MQEELPDSEFPTESGTDDNTDEVCALSKEQIKVVPSSSWPSDTACTSHMSDKIYLFSNLIPIKRRTIRVGGGVMYAEFKGSARLVCEDGSYTTLPDTLFVPNLGVNLLSARRMCDTGLRGYFDSNRMYFKLENKIMIHAKIHHGLYVVNHVSKKLESLIHKKPDNSAFAVMDVNPFQVEDGSMTPVVSPMADYDQTNDKDSSEYIGQSEKERYMLWHRRFAHLGPEKLRNLHKVTTLREAIKIPKHREICDVCQLTKMTNKFPNLLSDHKSSRLSLIQLDIAGPFPKSLRGNRYFLLIIDSFSRKNWVIPLKQKSDAISSLQSFKAAVENEINEKIKAVRSDNALSYYLRWRAGEKSMGSNCRRQWWHHHTKTG